MTKRLNVSGNSEKVACLQPGETYAAFNKRRFPDAIEIKRLDAYRGDELSPKEREKGVCIMLAISQGCETLDVDQARKLGTFLLAAAADALTESGKASAGIVAKLEAENTALHEDCNKAMKAMQACLDLEKRDVAFVIHREAQLHETLRLFALPTDPKAFAREMNGRNKDRDELCERLAKLESDNKTLHDALACATMDSLGKAIRGES